MGVTETAGGARDPAVVSSGDVVLTTTRGMDGAELPDGTGPVLVDAATQFHDAPAPSAADPPAGAAPGHDGSRSGSESGASMVSARDLEPLPPKPPTTGPKVYSVALASLVCGSCSVMMQAVLIAAASSLLSGYDQGVIASAMLTMREDLGLSGVQEELAIGVVNISAAIGAIGAGALADRYGRKRAIACAHALFFLGSIIITGALGFWALFLGRILQGFGVGTALVVPPILKAELVPPEQRGGLVAIGDVCTNLGILLGYAAGLAFYGVPGDWRLMFAVGALPAAVLLALIWAVPESPRWLVTHGQEIKARRILESVFPDRVRAVGQLRAIKEALAEERTKPEPRWIDVAWPSNPVERRQMHRGLGVAFFSQATGTEAVVYYAASIVQQAGVTDVRQTLLAIMGVGFCKLVFLTIGASLFDRVGRRPLLLSSAAGIFGSLCILVLGSVGEPSAALAITGLCCFMASFSAGLSPLVYVVCSELFPASMRARGMALALFVTRTVAGVISSSFVSLREGLTPAGAWLIFIPVAFGAFVFIYTRIPETKGVPLEQIPTLFAEGSAGCCEPPSLPVTHVRGASGTDAAGAAGRRRRLRDPDDPAALGA